MFSYHAVKRLRLYIAFHFTIIRLVCLNVKKIMGTLFKIYLILKITQKLLEFVSHFNCLKIAGVFLEIKCNVF